MRKVSPQKIVDAAPKTLTVEDARRNVGLAFVPSIEENFTNRSEHDMPFLTEHPNIILKEGRFNKIPVLIGFNEHEAMLFIRRKFIHFINIKITVKKDDIIVKSNNCNINHKPWKCTKILRLSVV